MEKLLSIPIRLVYTIGGHILNMPIITKLVDSKIKTPENIAIYEGVKHYLSGTEAAPWEPTPWVEVPPEHALATYMRYPAHLWEIHDGSLTWNPWCGTSVRMSNRYRHRATL